jgi:hypothetical protein
MSFTTYIRNSIRFIFPTIIALLIAFSWDICHYFWGIISPPHQVRYLLFGTGFLALLAGFADSNILPRVLTNFSLTIMSVVLVFGLGEILLHFTGYDFDSRKYSAWLRIPPYYRMPTNPQGEIFFRRPGPDSWTGNIIHTRAKQLGYSTDIYNIYKNDPVVTIRYDSNGFRNDENLSNWHIAVAGDSFTELGYLPQEELFTSILSNLLNVPVLNLGVSYTGPLTHVSYLREFGISDTTRHLLIVFFEGNDLLDLVREYQALERWKNGGKRELRQFTTQTSLVPALLEGILLFGKKLKPKSDNDLVQAFFNTSKEKFPVTLNYAPPGMSQIRANTSLMEKLHYFFKEYSSLKNDTVTTWLAYMPCKHRVLYNFLEYSPETDIMISEWIPSDLPVLIQELSKQYGVQFIDLTPALVSETTKSKKLVYNSLFDSHLNRYGSEIVGHELARHLTSLRSD